MPTTYGHNFIDVLTMGKDLIDRGFIARIDFLDYEVFEMRFEKGDETHIFKYD